MSNNEKPADVSMSNTKKEILEAYDEMKALLKRKEGELTDAEKAKEQMKKQAAVAEADRVSAESPSAQLQELKQRFARELTGLAEEFETSVEQYEKLKVAIAEKRQELETMYGVESAAIDLRALLEAQKHKKETFQEEMEIEQAEFENEMEQARREWEREQEMHEQRVKERDEQLKKERRREQEEYDYQLKRERELRQNQLNDDLAALESEIAARRAEFERTISEKQAELDRREKDVAERETLMNELQRQVDAFPAEKAKAVETAVAELQSRLEADFQKNEQLLQRTFEGEKNVLLSKIESLESLAAAQSSQIKELEGRQARAYEQVQDIASKAVTSSRTHYPFPQSSNRGKESEGE